MRPLLELVIHLRDDHVLVTLAIVGGLVVATVLERGGRRVEGRGHWHGRFLPSSFSPLNIEQLSLAKPPAATSSDELLTPFDNTQILRFVEAPQPIHKAVQVQATNNENVELESSSSRQHTLSTSQKDGHVARTLYNFTFTD